MCFANTNTFTTGVMEGGVSCYICINANTWETHRVVAALLPTDSSDVCWSHSGNHTCQCSFYQWDHWGPSTPAPLQLQVPLPDVPGGFPQMSLLWFLVKHCCLVGWPVSALGHRTLAFRCVSQQEFGPAGLTVLVYWSMNQ